MAKITCALLDERGIYQGMVEIDEAAAGPLHLPQISRCDLPVGEYRWQADKANPFGGHFVPLPTPQRANAGRPTLEHAIAFELLGRWQRQEPITEVALTWLDDVLQSVDFGPALKLEVVQTYGRARGLKFAKKEG